MASRMLSALLPLNDMPFFKFELSSGINPDPEVYSYLENLSYQVYSKFSSRNLRESIYQVLQNLIVVGDVMIIMNDDMDFRIIRLDRYVCRRDVYGGIEELIYIEYETIPEDKDNSDVLTSSSLTAENKQGYKPIYNQLTKKDDGTWLLVKEDEDGGFIESGEFTVPNLAVLRWTSVPGENYGRSHCEDIIGDIKTLEAFTEGLTNGIAAATQFWISIDPTGITEVDDLAGAPVGQIISARGADVDVISPARTIHPQIQATQVGVDTLRREIGKAFLMDSASIPSGERVTATAIRMIGQELEHVLGGAFSAVARDLMEPIVKRVIFLMLANEEIDPRLKDMFDDDETLLSVEIVTGLQALSRDSDLSKLMQMGEMVRNLPEQAAAMFRWDYYGKALITSLGFNADQWIKNEEDVKREQLEMAQAQAQIQGASNRQMATDQAVMEGMSEAAMMDLQATGGQGIQQAMQGVM